MTYNEINDIVNYTLSCIDWDMSRFCWENNYISPVNEFNEFGEVVDFEMRVTGKDVLEALDDLGVPYSEELRCELLLYGIE